MMTLNIMPHDLKGLFVTLSIKTLSINDTQYQLHSASITFSINDIQHSLSISDIQHMFHSALQ
jgi:hypothetical protein